MILAFDTSTAACTAALFGLDGECIGSTDQVIGRGHAERLAPMLEELLHGRAADRILVGVGPGSFTGLRVGIAAAHGLAIGWGAELKGLSSLALVAASAGVEGEVAAAMIGGHGELFVQQFDAGLQPASDLLNLAPAAAGAAISAETVVGPGAASLVEARGYGTSVEAWPSAASTPRLPASLLNLAPAPLYGRAPDAKASVAA